MNGQRKSDRGKAAAGRAAGKPRRPAGGAKAPAKPAARAKAAPVKTKKAAAPARPAPKAKAAPPKTKKTAAPARPAPKAKAAPPKTKKAAAPARPAPKAKAAPPKTKKAAAPARPAPKAKAAPPKTKKAAAPARPAPKAKAAPPKPKKAAAPARPAPKAKAAPPKPKKAAAPARPAPKAKAAPPKPKKAAAKKPGKPAFPRGSWGVDPSHGPGRIAGRETQTIAGRKIEFLIVEFAREKMSLKIPKDRVEEMGLRPISTGRAIRAAMDKLKEPAHVKRSMWSRRAQEYESKLHSGDLIQIAEVLRDLYRAPDGPEQSFSERELYKAALDRFSREISAAESIPLDRACMRLEAALKKAD